MKRISEDHKQAVAELEEKIKSLTDSLSKAMSEAATAVLESETTKNRLLEEKELSNRRASQLKEKETAINNLSSH